MNFRGRQNESSVEFYLNDELVLEIDKQKLLDRSAYFKALFKKCYRDHQSDLIDVFFPEKEEMFYKMMQLISNGSITLDINTIFETYHLATYFQIGCLQKFCLDHFTLNLNRRTLQFQLYEIANISHLCLREFTKRALMFKGTGNISFSGLYFLQENSEGACLVNKSKHTKYAHVFKQFYKMYNFNRLHYVDKMLCSLVSVKPSCFLLQYDLLSGSVHRHVLEGVNKIEDGKWSVCTGNKNLYLLVGSGKKDDPTLRVSLLRRKEEFGCLEVCKTKTFSLPKLLRTQVFRRTPKLKRIHFSHCHDDKLYVFYHMTDRKYTQFNSFYDTFLLVLCSKTFRVLKNRKLSTENVRLGLQIGFRRLREVEMWAFKKLFFSEKHKKLFIKINCGNWNNQSRDMYVLVFDIKRDFFYFDGNILPLFPLNKSNRGMFATCKDGKVHVVSSNQNFNGICSEIRRFKFDENERLAIDGVVWKSMRYPSSNGCGAVLSACFV